MDNIISSILLFGDVLSLIRFALIYYKLIHNLLIHFKTRIEFLDK